MSDNDQLISTKDLREMLDAKETQFRSKIDKEVLEFVLETWNRFESIDLHTIFIANDLKKDHSDDWKKMIEVSFFNS